MGTNPLMTDPGNLKKSKDLEAAMHYFYEMAIPKTQT